MDYKTLVKRFAKACYRFEALQENLDILLFDTDDEIKANEYKDLADQAAEIVLKLSANGHNVGEHFFDYYVRRLEYIVAYFRELLDDENDTQAAESDKGGSISDDDLPLPPGVEEKPTNLWLGWEKLTREERWRVKDSVALFYRLDDIAAQDEESPVDPILALADSPHTLLQHYIRFATAQSILAEEQELRRLLWKAIDAIPGFRDSKKFKELIEQYPTYKEKEQ